VSEVFRSKGGGPEVEVVMGMELWRGESGRVGVGSGSVACLCVTVAGV
jgi:hypothetical protein